MRVRLIKILLVTTWCLPVALCWADDKSPTKTSPTGTVRGVVKFDGKRTPEKPVNMRADPICADYYKNKIPPSNERSVWGVDGTLQNVIIYVSQGLPKKKFPVPKKPAVLATRGCMYHPHVQVVRTGQSLILINRDRTLHSHRITSDKTKEPETEALPVRDQMKEMKYLQPQKLSFQCDVHSWSSAHVHVLDHPFHAVSDTKGTFEIKGLPPGEYELTAWHELRRFTPDRNPIKVTVKGGKVSELVITYSASID